MKKLLYIFSKIMFLVIVFSFTNNVVSAQSPAWQWVNSAGTGDIDVGKGCVTDADGNVIVTGFFQFSSISFGTTAVTNAGGYDIFLVKYDSIGNVLWATSAGGSSDDKGISCTVDLNGDIIVTGFFSGLTITFDTIVLTNSIAWTSEIFIVKYDSDGNVIWARSEGGNDHDFVNYCSTDAFGNIYVTGRFDSDTMIVGTTVLTNAGASDIYILKYDNNGNVIFAKSVGGSFFEDVQCCAIDINGNVVITGHFNSPTLYFGTNVLTNTSPSPFTDMFIVKYDPNGNVLWAKSAGGTNYEYGNSCATDAAGNIIVTGSFGSNNISFGTTVLSNTGVVDIYIVKYDSLGNELWAMSEGGTGAEAGMSCTTDLSGNIIVTGTFNSPTLTLGTTVLYHANDLDIFIVKFDSTGNFMWANSVGDIFDEYVWNCTTDINGNIIFAGSFESYSLNFGSVVIYNVDGYDMFVAKLDSNLNQVGINNMLFEDNRLFLYPNPTTGELKVHCSKFYIQSVEIYNILGEILISTSNQLTFDVSHLNSGVYFVRLIGENEAHVEKFMKE